MWNMEKQVKLLIGECVAEWVSVCALYLDRFDVAVVAAARFGFSLFVCLFVFIQTSVKNVI